jgi:cytochrome c peroxidase
MKISVGQKMPNSTLSYFGPDGVSQIELIDLLKGKKVVIFALPGAFTNTCSSKHLPGFIEKSARIIKEGVDEIICISVNDPFVMSKWGETTGAIDVGIKMLADPASDFTKSIGTEFTVPPIGFFNRSKRCAFIVENQKIVYAYLDDASGVVTGSSAEAILLNLQDS